MEVGKIVFGPEGKQNVPGSPLLPEGSVNKNGWLPIESAPKDEDVLVFLKVQKVVLKAHFISRHAAGYGSIGRDIYYPNGWHEVVDEIGFIEMFEQPTHWQPLPKPPEGPK